MRRTLTAITLLNAETPLDFAYLACKRIKWYGAQLQYLRATALRVNMFEKNLKKALKILAEAAKIQEKAETTPDDRARDYAPLSETYEELGCHNEALGILRKATLFAGMAPRRQKSAEALACVGASYIRISEKEKAVSVLDRAYELIKRRKKAVYYMDDWGSFIFSGYMATNEYMKALKMVKKLEKGDLACALVEFSMAGGHYEKEIFKAGVEIANQDVPSRDYYYRWIACFIAGKGHFDEAAQFIRRIHEPSLRVNAVISLAVELYKNGRRKDTRKLLTEAENYYLKQPHDNNHYLSGLVALYRRLGWKKKVLKLLKRALIQANALPPESRYKALAGLLEPYAEAGLKMKVEDFIDAILDAPLYGPCDKRLIYHPAVPILYNIAAVIAEYDLNFTGKRVDALRERISIFPDYPYLK